MHSYDGFGENEYGKHSNMHENSYYAVGSSRYFSMFDFSADDGADLSNNEPAIFAYAKNGRIGSEEQMTEVVLELSNIS